MHESGKFPKAVGTNEDFRQQVPFEYVIYIGSVSLQSDNRGVLGVACSDKERTSKHPRNFTLFCRKGSCVGTLFAPLHRRQSVAHIAYSLVCSRAGMSPLARSL